MCLVYVDAYLHVHSMCQHSKQDGPFSGGSLLTTQREHWHLSAAYAGLMPSVLHVPTVGTLSFGALDRKMPRGLRLCGYYSCLDPSFSIVR